MREMAPPPSPKLLFDLLEALDDPAVRTTLAVVVARCRALVDAMTR